MVVKTLKQHLKADLCSNRASCFLHYKFFLFHWKNCGRLSRLGWIMRTRSSSPIIYVYFLLLCGDHLQTFLWEGSLDSWSHQSTIYLLLQRFKRLFGSGLRTIARFIASIIYQLVVQRITGLPFFCARLNSQWQVANVGELLLSFRKFPEPSLTQVFYSLCASHLPCSLSFAE
jgi:hypothetical protein